MENRFSSTTSWTKITSLQKTDLFKRREHACHMMLKQYHLCMNYLIAMHCTFFFFFKHISQIIRIISKDIKALYNAQLTLRCSQGLYLCETMNDKEEKLVSNDKSVRLSLVTTIHPLGDMKGQPKFKSAIVYSVLIEVALQLPAQRMYKNYHF